MTEHELHMQKHVIGYLKHKYQGIEIEDFKISWFTDHQDEHIDCVVRRIYKDIPDELWNKDTEEYVEADLLKIEFTMVGIRRANLDLNHLRILLNKAASGAWPKDDYNIDFNIEEYDVDNYDDCWHMRRIETAQYSDGVTVELIAGLCYCS